MAAAPATTALKLQQVAASRRQRERSDQHAAVVRRPPLDQTCGAAVTGTGGPRCAGFFAAGDGELYNQRRALRPPLAYQGCQRHRGAQRVSDTVELGVAAIA
ncbi:unnamed protein product [Urochloa humidicola]